MKKLLLFILICYIFSSCTKEMFNKTSSSLSKATLQIKDKTISGDGFIVKTDNNEAVFLLSSTGNKSNFDKAVVVAFEKKINIPIESGSLQYADVIYFEDKRSLVIHSKKENKIYLFGLDEKQSYMKLNMLKENPELRGNKFVVVLGYGISVLSGSWNKDLYLTNTSPSAFARLVYSNNYLNSTQALPATIPPSSGKCTSGGPGATSCSITEMIGGSCSVSCGNGYYACCNSASITCNCVSNN